MKCTYGQNVMCPVLEADLYFEVILLSYKNSCNTWQMPFMYLKKEQSHSHVTRSYRLGGGGGESRQTGKERASTPAIVGSEP